MKKDILSLLLQAESEFQAALRGAVEEAEQYVDDRRSEQAAYVEELKREWHLFEQTEADELERALAAEGQRMEEEALRIKEQLRTRKEREEDRISEGLKEEVLSLLWR